MPKTPAQALQAAQSKGFAHQGRLKVAHGKVRAGKRGVAAKFMVMRDLAARFKR